MPPPHHHPLNRQDYKTLTLASIGLSLGIYLHRTPWQTSPPALPALSPDKIP